MDDDFFSNQTPVSQGYHPHSTGDNEANNNADDQFDFGGTTYETPKLTQHHYSNPLELGQHGAQSSGLIIGVDPQTTRKIQEEEDRIHQQLRQKANKEYEQKQKRKEKGRKELDAFLERKQQEIAQRKRQNKLKQAKKLEQTKQLNDTAGWKKVAANVALKQGENAGKKDITRMRESIINKRQDQA